MYHYLIGHHANTLYGTGDLEIVEEPDQRLLALRQRFRPLVLDYDRDGETSVAVIGRVVWHCIPARWSY